MGQKKKSAMTFQQKMYYLCYNKKLLIMDQKYHIYCIKLNINSKYKLHIFQLSSVHMVCILFSLFNYIDY